MNHLIFSDIQKLGALDTATPTQYLIVAVELPTVEEF